MVVLIQLVGCICGSVNTLLLSPARPPQLTDFIHFKKIPSRNVISLINRWKINSFKTIYVSTAKCICGSHISPEHILLCEQMKEYLPADHCSESAECTLTYHFVKYL